MSKEILFKALTALINDQTEEASLHLKEALSKKSSMLVSEKWGVDTKVSDKEKGKYKDWTLEELRDRLAELKKSGPHARASKEFGEERELMFAIRAKTGWGKVSEAFGDKRDFPKIEIFVDGEYKATTTWSKTCKEAIEKYKETHPEAKDKKVTANFDPRNKR